MFYQIPFQMLVTTEFYNSLRKELGVLLESRRYRSDDLAVALSYGDLRENSAFDIATEKYKFAEKRISELQKLLHEHKPIDSTKINPEVVGVGASVILEINGKKQTYFLVNSVEADPSQNKISIDSPIGKLLYNKNVEEIFDGDWELDSGVRFRVVSISYI